jgi:hypothetical protein
MKKEWNREVILTFYKFSVTAIGLGWLLFLNQNNLDVK